MEAVYAMKYRIKFTKVDKIRFIGHLDLLKLFQRAIKRAELPVAYSNGFNPHQLIGFAVPLPLGMASIGEYVDVEFKEEIDNLTIKDNLNNVMPDGIEIIDVRKFTEKDKSCASVLEAALYEVCFDEKIYEFSDIIRKMFLQDSFEIERTSKHKTKVVNIKPDIFSFDEIENEKYTVFKTIISTGSHNNLKPELLVKYIYGFMGRDYEPLKVKYKRIELFKKDNGQFLKL